MYLCHNRKKYKSYYVPVSVIMLLFISVQMKQAVLFTIECELCFHAVLCHGHWIARLAQSLASLSRTVSGQLVSHSRWPACLSLSLVSLSRTVAGQLNCLAQSLASVNRTVAGQCISPSSTCALITALRQ